MVRNMMRNYSADVPTNNTNARAERVDVLPTVLCQTGDTRFKLLVDAVLHHPVSLYRSGVITMRMPIPAMPYRCCPYTNLDTHLHQCAYVGIHTSA